MSVFRRRLINRYRILVTSLLPPVFTTFEQLEAKCTRTTPCSANLNSYWGYRPEFMNGITLVTHIIIPSKINGLINFCKYCATTGDIVYKFIINAVQGLFEYKLENPILLNSNESIAFLIGTSTSGTFYFMNTSESYFLERGFSYENITDSLVVMPYLVKGYR